MSVVNLSLSVLVFATAVFTSFSSLGQQCGSFAFGRSEYVDRIMSRSTAKVYRQNGDDLDYEGAAILLDKDARLFLTAKHVVRDTPIVLKVPEINTGEKFVAHVIRSDYSGGLSRTSEDLSILDDLDFALLQTETPIHALTAPEVWFAEINTEWDHIFYGFSRDKPHPLPDKIRLTPFDECTFLYRGNTFPGDSGSPVFSAEGLLVGIIVQQSETGAYSGGAGGQGVVLALRCLDPAILIALEQLDPNAGPEELSQLQDGDRQRLKERLRPPPSDGWIPNLRLAQLADLMTDEPEKVSVPKGNFICPIGKAVSDRKLGLARVWRLAQAEERSEKETAEELQNLSIEYSIEGNIGGEKDFLRLAIRKYESFLSPRSNYLRAALDSTGPSALPTPASALVAQAFKGLADASLKLGGLESNSDMLHAAAASAAAAALISQKPRLRASALATVGSAKLKTNKYDTAIKAYTSAKLGGFAPDWIKGDYQEAFRLKDNVLDAARANNYRELGSYEELDRSELIGLASDALSLIESGDDAPE